MAVARMRFRAPGRVNLIGDHTDYNDGFVLPMAIQLETVVQSMARGDRQLVLHSNDAPGTPHVVVDLGAPLRPRHDWTDYVIGVVHVVQAEGHALHGAELSIASTVPQGAGLSSSAALEVASAFALLDGRVPDRVTLARWCQRAENDFVGARSGIMDQYIACLGQPGHALLIDCRSLQHRAVPIPDTAAIIVSNSMIRHRVAAGEYNVRRQQCEEAVASLQRVLPHVRSLRDVAFTDLSAQHHDLSPTAVKRARHVVSENARVVDAADALARRDLPKAGQLMRDSHVSLRDDFEVSVAEVDALVDIANALPGVFGSRMTGGGFGGCTVTLAEHRAAPAIVDAIREQYRRQIGIDADVLVCVPAAGASEVAS